LKSKTIIEEWNNIEIPSPPEIIDVIINPNKTAFLVLDLQMNNCNEERRPRCTQRLAIIANFLFKVREKKMLVVYALTSSATKENIRSEVFPLLNEPIVQSGVDKFYNTDLESILLKKKINTVIIVGTSAHGAVLHTATGASLRNFKVIIPIEGLSASEAYAEQYTIWHLANGPGTRRNVTLTKFDLINFER